MAVTTPKKRKLQIPDETPSDPNRDLGGGWICETKCKVLCQITCEVKYQNICQINFPNTCQNVRRLSDPWRNTKTCMSKLACKFSKITWSKRGSETRCRCSAMRVPCFSSEGALEISRGFFWFAVGGVGRVSAVPN